MTDQRSMNSGFFKRASVQEWLAKYILGGITTGYLMLLYLPLLVIIILSFTGPEGGVTFPLRGVSGIWYQETLNNHEIRVALWRSFALAVVAMFISVTLGTMAAQVFRRRFKGDNLVFYLIILGIVAPGVIIGLGLALLFRQLNITPHWYTTGLLAHVEWTLPFCFLIMVTMFNRLNPEVEEAAATLGGAPWYVYRHVTLPIMTPGLMASALFGFTLSFDEVPRSLFVMGSSPTLPPTVFGTLTARIEPSLYALGAVITGISLSVVALYFILGRRVARKR